MSSVSLERFSDEYRKRDKFRRSRKGDGTLTFVYTGSVETEVNSERTSGEGRGVRH